jgi:hypothetical protein
MNTTGVDQQDRSECAAHLFLDNQTQFIQDFSSTETPVAIISRSRFSPLWQRFGVFAIRHID